MVDLEKVRYPWLHTQTPYIHQHEYSSSLGPSWQLRSGWIGSWGWAGKLGLGQANWYCNCSWGEWSNEDDRCSEPGISKMRERYQLCKNKKCVLIRRDLWIHSKTTGECDKRCSYFKSCRQHNITIPPWKLLNLIKWNMLILKFLIS